MPKGIPGNPVLWVPRHQQEGRGCALPDLTDLPLAPAPLPLPLPLPSCLGPRQGPPRPLVCPSSRHSSVHHIWPQCSRGGRGGADITQEGGLACWRGSGGTLGRQHIALEVGAAGDLSHGPDTLTEAGKAAGEVG